MTDREELGDRVAGLYQDFAAGEVDRRGFMQRAATLGVAGAATGALDLLSASPSAAQVTAAAGAATGAAAIDVAEWSYFWLGVKRAELARGTVVNGSQMYVEYWIPKVVKHPYPMVIVHGGGGQGLDWLGTPDGRPGWVTLLIQAGYKVYLVDRPGHGRSPNAPELQGPWPAQATTYAGLEHQFSAPEKATDPYGPQAKLHTRWPGTGLMGDPATDQVVCGQGGWFLPDLGETHRVWAERGGELLDRIGPAVVMAHSMGGPSLWIYANARPTLVKGLVGVEPGGPPFGNFKWGVTASPVAYDPPISDPSELKTVEIPAKDGRSAYRLQAEPARKLKNLAHIPIVVVTSPASYHWPYDLGTVAYLRQAGCSVDHVELEKIGITGNAHFMIMETNNREVLQPILQWLDRKVTAPAKKAGVKPAPARKADSTALDLADHGFFWVGAQPKTMPYGTIVAGQMFVQYLIPRQVRHATPIVLVHGGSGQMLHYMGAGGGASGWAHYYVQQGYKVYLVDRAGHGRSVYHPDALGPSSPIPTYESIGADILRGKKGGRWTGTGRIGDPMLDQFMASQNPTPRDGALAMAIWRRGGAALLDRIGPAVIQTHSAGGAFGWVVADERPALVKAIASFEGAGAPLIQPKGPPQLMPKLKGIPVAYFVAQNSGRMATAPAVVAALNASGAKAEMVAFADHGVTGNGHFAMIETNRRAPFDLIEGWVAKTVG